MYDDISHILKNWKFNEHDINVRLIPGMDGLKKIQLRLDLGLLQMELDGRPDGKKPQNCESYLDYFQSKVKKRIEKMGSDDFHLSPMDCFKLQQEAVQYYHRYIALMKLQDYRRVSRDTERNLNVFDFVEQYADNDEVIWQFQQYRPYVIMMNTRARASLQLDRSRFDSALKTIERGIKAIERYNQKWRDRLGPDFPELEFLQDWYDEIVEKRPLSEKERLTNELNKAIAEENYERAAKLRDMIASKQ